MNGRAVAEVVAWTPVEMDRVALELFAPVRVRLVGFSEQVAFCGAPLQVSATVPVAPVAPLSCRVKLAVCPLVRTAAEDPVTPRLKSSPAPESDTVMALGRLSAVTVTVPVDGPVEVGEKVIPIWHAAPTPSVDGQLFEVMAKPVVTEAVRPDAAEPLLLVMVRSWAALVDPTAMLPKAMEAGVAERPGGATPVPLS